MMLKRISKKKVGKVRGGAAGNHKYPTGNPAPLPYNPTKAP